MSTKTGKVNEYSLFTLTMSFPKGEETCQLCDLITYDRNSDSRRCRLTAEHLIYWRIGRGEKCPLIQIQ